MRWRSRIFPRTTRPGATSVFGWLRGDSSVHSRSPQDESLRSSDTKKGGGDGNSDRFERDRRPIDRVFQTFTDIEHGPAHVSGIKKLEMITPGPVHVGTRWLETREVMGHLDTAEMEITAFERNRMYTITHHKAGVRIDTKFWVEPSGDRTKVTWSSTSTREAFHRVCSRRLAGRLRARSKRC
jgi:carbon monoxide dehydrogenase subunit G